MVTSSPEAPLLVRSVTRMIGEWVGRLGRVWVEGQIAELTRRPGSNTVFVVLRDPLADVSLPATLPRALCDAVDPPLAEGQRVVVHAKPEWYLNRGRLQLAVTEVRPIGLGALLARLEQLKRLLAQEGLFDKERKRLIPFLPRTVGLICGRESEAKHDVVENATRRWPAVRFEVREVVVQGTNAVGAVTTALRELDRQPEVDVIVLARGGGSVEDLLPFSDESLCRAVAACLTPVISAIGHEQDAPLVDFVADRRASTPTDAGRMVVPDVAEQAEAVLHLRRRAWRCVSGRIEREEAWLQQARSRPALANPIRLIETRADETHALLARARSALGRSLDTAEQDVTHNRARVRALSPAATLDRGYAVVQAPSGDVVRDAGTVVVGDALRVRLAAGELGVEVRQVIGGGGTSASPGGSGSSAPADQTDGA